MSSEATENLFLLEFLVDSLELGPQCECASPPGETCVAFTFLDNAPLEICEEDFSPAMKYGQDNARLKSGKSCLFSLTAEQVTALSAEFDVTVSVLKKMQSGWLPDKIQVGAAVISIANLFTEMIQGIQISTAPESPTSKTLKDVFKILNTEGIQVGKIGVYIRMSCFGKLIVTQFQMNFEDKSVLFKDKEGKSLYRYKKAPKGKEHKIDDMGSGECDKDCPFTLSATNSDDDQCSPSCPGLQPTTQPTSNKPCPSNVNKETTISQVSVGTNPNVPPCIECMGRQEAPCVPQQVGNIAMPPMSMGYTQPMAIPQMMQPGMGMPHGMGIPGFLPGMTPCNEYGMLQDAPCLQGMMETGGRPGMQQGLMGCSPSCEGIQHLIEAQKLQGMQPTGPPPPPPGNYQEIGATLGTNKLTIRVHKNSKVEPSEGNPANITKETKGDNKDQNISGGDSCTCCPGAAAERHRKKEQMGSQQQQLQSQAYNMGMGIPQGDSRIPFSFKMGCMGQGAGGAAGKNVVVQPPTTVTADGTQFTEISDPDKDLFILRIGKKSEGIDKKNNLELELCTPRAPDYKPRPRQETRDTQFEASDLTAVDKTKGGKKGEKGKGKDKGGKGKKGKKK